MIKYTVSIEIDGHMVTAGYIEGTDHRDALFRYAGSYLSIKTARAISISLPLQEAPFSSVQTRRFFDGLLPEGFTRRSVASWTHGNENDYLSILHALGKECLGAIRISSDDDKTDCAYEPLSMEQVKALAAEGASKSAELVTKSHLSLTGASGKVGLYYDKKTGNWYMPIGTAPSTHIVKQSHVRLDSIVTNEQLVLKTAKLCGIDTADSFIINTGEAEDRDILLASARYDRFFSNDSETITGLPIPRRLHQEDFSQALGIASEQKYEAPDDDYLQKMFILLRNYSAEPIKDQLKLWDLIVFNWLAGNTDAHLKNFSLLYSQSMASMTLAPAYDLLSTSIYENSTRNMAFHIGDGISLDEIDRQSFAIAAKEAGLGEKMALGRFDQIAGKFPSALRRAAEELLELGFAKAPAIADRILNTGGIRSIAK